MALLVLVPTPAMADGWFVVEAPAAIAVSDVQDSVFRPGVMPALGVYADNGRLALGLRVRAGVLRNGPAPGNGLDDPGVGGLATGGLAFRFLFGHAWTEVVVGGGITGHDVVPAVEAGVGWGLEVGKLTIGPSLRYIRVYSRDTMSAFGTADLAVVGVDVRFGKRHRARLVPPPPPVAIVAPVAIAPAERDDDEIVEREQSCVQALEGCPLGDAIIVHNDRIVLDERVLFDFDRARVRSRGREMIARILKLWWLHPDWKRITVEGHTDIRGTDAYNQDLSQRRADHVRDVFRKLGTQDDKIDAVGFGRSRPVDTGETEDAHTHNRRVEIVIERSEP